MEPHALKKPQTRAVFQETTEPFRAVWEAASDAMALSAPDGTVFAANPAYYQLYGLTPEEVIGKNFSIIFSKEEQKSAEALYDYIFKSPTIRPSFETNVVRGDGTERFVESSYSFIIQNGERIAMLSIIRDITERKKVEEALLVNREKLQLALEAAHMNTWDWDIVSNKILLPANLEAAFGLTPDTFGATYEAFLELVHPEDRAMFDQQMKQAIKEGSDYKIEFRIVRPDDTMRWTAIHSQVLYDETGKPLRMIVIDVDIQYL